jgi:hypothetical protein
MNSKPTAQELRDKIAKYRALARTMTDPVTEQRIVELARELERELHDLERD